MSVSGRLSSDILLVSSIYNEDLSTPAQKRVCSNPRYIYYYDDETIPFQSFLCRLGFSPFFMKFYEKKNEFQNDHNFMKKNSKMMLLAIQEKILRLVQLRDAV